MPTNGDHPTADGAPTQTPASAPNSALPPAAPPHPLRLSAFEDFMETGDLPTPVSTSVPRRTLTEPTPRLPPPPSDLPVPPASESSPVLSSLPPTAPAAAAAEPTEQLPEADPAPTAQDTASFFTGLFRKAATTLESTLESAKRDISRNPVISTAQEGLVELSNAFLPSPPPALQALPSAPREAAMNGERPGLPAKTTALRALKLNHSTGAEPLLLFVGGPARDIFVVTDSTIEAFAWDGPKILQFNMTDVWASADQPAATPPDDATPPRRPSAVRATRVNSRAPDDAIRAVSAAHAPAEEEILVGLADGSLRVFSARSGQMGAQLRSSPPGPAPPTALFCLPGAALVGRADGALALVDAATLAPTATLPPPAMAATPLAAETRHPPVTCVAAAVPPLASGAPGAASGSAPAALGDGPLAWPVAAGFEDGTVAAGRFAEPGGGAAFAAHAGGVSGVVPLFGGAVMVSIGGEEDPSLCATVAATGRCALRRMLPYVPTTLSGVSRPPSPPAAGARASPQAACPSEGALLVGGADGELDVFWLVPLGAGRLEFRLLRKLSERTRGRRRAVVAAAYAPADALLLALARGGEVRRWRLCPADAALLARTGDGGADGGGGGGGGGGSGSGGARRARFHAGNVRAALAGRSTDPEETRLAVGEGVIAAQRVLAAVLEDDVGVDEAGKDALVEQFQRMQADMQDTASQTDAELRRARLRIARRFAGVVEPAFPPADDGEKRIADAALRFAALELNGANEKHAAKLARIRATTVKQLRVVLLQTLRGATGSPERVSMIRQAAEDLIHVAPEN